MAQPANLMDTYDARGIREDLSNIIFRVTPTETPMLSSIKRNKATATMHDWQTDALAAVDLNNAQVDGDDASLAEPAATVRVRNHTQILRKVFGISGTLEAVRKAGRASETAYQLTKRGLELRRDIEAMIMGKNAASVAGTSSVARISGSLSSWLVTNDTGTPGASPANRGAGGAPGGYSSVTGLTVAATDGTTRAFDQPILDALVAKIWDSSGTVEDSVIHAGATQKQKITNFDGIASQVQTQTSGMKVIATADIYVSQFGSLRIVPNRHIRKTAGVDREIYIVRPSMLKLSVLRPIFRRKLGITGDSDKTALYTECTLEVCNEAAHGVAADLSA